MLREVALLLSDALDHPETGVAAIVGTMPRLPNDPIPLGRGGALLVANEYTNEQVAKGEDLSIIPALLVLTDGPSEVAGESGRGQVGQALRVTVLLYDRADNLLLAKATGAIILRAVRRCLNHYVSRTAQDDRTLNQIRILDMTRMTEARYPDQRRGKATLTGGVQATVRAFDLDP
jgi:hypothetical protein